MATLSKKDADNLLLQLQEAQKMLDSKKPLATATAMPVLNAAQMGGASGIGFEDSTIQTNISTGVKKAADAGIPKADAGNYDTSKKGSGGLPTTVNAERANFILSGAGLTGIIRPEKLVGMTTADAQKLVAEQKAKQTSQTSAGTSAVYNPETINKTKRAVDNFGFALNAITKDPFNGKESKVNKTNALIESASKQLAKLFKTPEEFQNAYNTNQTFKEAIDNFQKMGGKADTVTSSIVAPVDPQNAPQTQDTASYLADIKNPQANQEAQDKAIAELVPERQLQQEEIARIAGIPKELQQHYFGSETEIGLIQEKKNQAEEKRIIEREEKNSQNNLRAQAKFAIDKNKADVQIQTAQVEENRLAAKNYMTGYLAKLGALNTTGAAGLAIQTLDTKYQIQKQTLETNAKYDNQSIELKLNDELNKVETDTDKQILKIQQDLSKSTEDVFKEVTKAQQEADKETARISLSYAKTLREKTDAYTKQMKKDAEDYAKKFAKIASGGLDLAKLSKSIEGGDIMEGQYVPKKGVLLPGGNFAKITLTPTQQQDVEAAGIMGLSNIRYFNNLPPVVRELITRDRVESGTNYDVAKMAQALKVYQDSQKKKTSSSEPDWAGIANALK
jgi:hypothetical protein